MRLDELKDEAPRDIPQERSLSRRTDQGWMCGREHRVINEIVKPHFSGYPVMSPLEADLMELMGDSLGG